MKRTIILAMLLTAALPLAAYAGIVSGHKFGDPRYAEKVGPGVENAAAAEPAAEAETDAAPMGAAGAEAVPSMNGALHVEGPELVDRWGRKVQLRGVSTHGVQWFPQYVNRDSFKEFRDKWHMNAVRLAMYTAEGGWCEAGSVKQSGYRELLAQGI